MNKEQIEEHFSRTPTREIEIADESAAHDGLTRKASVLLWDEVRDFDHVFRLWLADRVAPPTWFIAADDWGGAVSGLIEAFPPELAEEIVENDDPEYENERVRFHKGEHSMLRFQQELGAFVSMERIEGVRLSEDEANKLRDEVLDS